MKNELGVHTTRTLTKPEKIALCRECHGTGKVKAGRFVRKSEPCPQCEGSGRVLVSCEMTLHIRPYQESN